MNVARHHVERVGLEFLVAQKSSRTSAAREKKIKEFGYVDTSEPKPLIRLACQAQALGAVSIVIPPWNGVYGKYLNKVKKGD